MKDDNRVINFNDVYIKHIVKENQEELSAIGKLLFDLTFLKLKGLQTSKGEHRILDDIPYDYNTICDAINKVNKFAETHYSNDDICKVTNLPDELSNLVVSYLTGNKMYITFSKLNQI